MLATIRLFKAVPLADWSGGISKANEPYIESVHRETVAKGFVIAPELIAAYRGEGVRNIIKTVDALYGSDPAQLNKSFHKSFSKVRDASLEQLYVEQIAHYMTTYGLELFGTYSPSSVYIPAEALDVPEIAEGFEYVVIRPMSYKELRIALLDLLSSGVALGEQTLQDCLAVAQLVRLDIDAVESVKNREAKVALYKQLDLVPTDPVEFLRYVIYEATGSTLLIKSRSAVADLKDKASAEGIYDLFVRYDDQIGHVIEDLGAIFNRFKPLFLALRANKDLRPMINRIRRAATLNHKPLSPDYLNNFTATIRQVEAFGKKMPELDRLREELESPSVNVFRKIRVARALADRGVANIDSIVYKIRNGKSFADDFAPLTLAQKLYAREALLIVMRSIVASVAPNLRGKSVYIPDGLVLGLPSSEKQFIGNLPSGTYVQLDPGVPMVAGVYWEDMDRHRIDLDLSVTNVDGKIGWDGDYRSGGVLFSGDNTSAANGASEVHYFPETAKGSWISSLNYYNFDPHVPVPAKIIVGTADQSSIDRNFVLDPNKTVASAPIVVDTHQRNLGVIVADPKGGHRFYFTDISVGGGRTARHGENAERARRFVTASMQFAPTLNEILTLAGASAVWRPEDASEGFDLSPAAIDKTTILQLLSGS